MKNLDWKRGWLAGYLDYVLGSSMDAETKFRIVMSCVFDHFVEDEGLSLQDAQRVLEEGIDD